MSFSPADAAQPRSQSTSKSLPQRWKRGRQRAALSALAALTLFTGALHGQGGADKLGGWWLRARFTGREWLNNQLKTPQPDPRIAILEIDDKSLDIWHQKGDGSDLSLAWGGHIAGAIEQLNRSGARLIALDWTQPNETDALMRWNNDERLGAALLQAKKVVFVKLVRSSGYILPARSLLYSLPDAITPDGKDNVESSLGFAELVTDDSVQSAIFPEYRGPDGSEKPEVSFAKRIAEQSGLELPSGRAPRRDGSLLINYTDNAGARGANSPFLRASLAEVANARVPDARWKDKIVLIGATYKGVGDEHYVPFLRGLTGSRRIAGVELQAHALQTLLDGDAIGEPEGAEVWLLAWLVGALGVSAFALWNWGRASLVIMVFALGWTMLSFALFWGANYSLPLVLPFLSLLLGSAIMGGYRALSEERERAQVMKIWGRYQDPRLIQEALDHPEWRSGEGRELEVTVLFADLKNFTKTVESLTPAQALEALNGYLALFATTIREHGGIVDKYLGDGLMAQWGAPTARADHATAAVRACLDIEKRIAQLTQRLQDEGKVWFEARLTLHTGPVIAGPLGAEEKLEYTVIGDTVNVTSRLQETAKALGCDFLISQTTCEALEGAVETGRMMEVEIRGRIAPLRVFEVLGKNIDEPSDSEKAKTSQKAP